MKIPIQQNHHPKGKKIEKKWSLTVIPCKGNLSSEPIDKYNIDKLSGMISFGGSPRASINLALASKAYAFLKRRGYVIPEDVRAVCHDVLRHRIGLTYEAEAENITSEEIISKILNSVEVP